MNNLKSVIDRDTAITLDQKYPKKLCNEIISFIDNYKSKDTEMNYGNSEIRIWDAHKKNKLILDFKIKSDTLLSNIYNKKIESYTILALKNVPIPSDGNQIKGRWHMDSLRKQIKIFTFLSDIEVENGPFEYIPKTNSYFFKMKQIFKGEYFSVKDFYRSDGVRKYQNIDDEFVDNLLKKTPSVKYICESGTTAIVDTSSLHRASPCLKGSRYYLCAYYNFF